MAILFSPWFWLALAVAAAGACGKGWIDEKSAFDSFKGAQAALGKEAEARSLATIKANQLAKEKADAENAQTVANLRAAATGLLRTRTITRYLPAPASGAESSPDINFDRAKLESAIQRLDSEVSAIVERGDEAIADLDTAKRWVQDTR